MEKLIGIAKELQVLRVDYMKRLWVQYTTGIELEVQESYARIQDFFKDKTTYQTILEQIKEITSHDDQRRAQLLQKEFEPFHLSDEANEMQLKIKKKSSELSQILNTFRYKLDGVPITSVELEQIIRNNTDRLMRKKAYFTRNQVNRSLLEGGFLELIELRKEYAKLRGFNDFVALALDESELTKALFEGWEEHLIRIKQTANEERAVFAKKYLEDTRVFPWDEAFISGQIAKDLNHTVDMMDYYDVLSTFFKKLDIDITKFNITYDVFSRANKSEWGYNFGIKTGVDTRILANVKDKFHEYNVLLHETGHAIHNFSVDPNDLLMQMGTSGIVTEGFANLMGDFLYEPLFYNRFFETEQVEASFKALKQWQRLTRMKFIHVTLFDHALYYQSFEQPEDVENLYKDMYEQFYGDMPFDQSPPWAYRIHHTTHPIYLHNYFVGDLLCEMLKNKFEEVSGLTRYTDDPVAFKNYVMAQIIEPMGKYPFGELFEKISGEKFSLKYL